MKPITLEWVAKAEGDWDAAQREYRARKRPNYDAACFHAQQCAEKYLKARLCEAAAPFPPTQNLVALLVLVLAHEPTVGPAGAGSEVSVCLRCRRTLSWTFRGQNCCA